MLMQKAKRLFIGLTIASSPGLTFQAIPSQDMTQHHNQLANVAIASGPATSSASGPATSSASGPATST